MRSNIVRAVAITALALAIAAPAVAVDQRPNILWLIAEDFGVDLGCYGAPEAVTPRLDALATEGTRFARFYTTCPVCSPSRSAFMTGMYQTTIGAHNHRSHRDDGYQLPEGVRLLTDWFRDGGYFTANIGKLPKGVDFKGTEKNDWNFTPPERPFDSNDWADLETHQPFFAQINFNETHRKFHAPKLTDPAQVRIPPYEPEHPVTRADRAAYFDSAHELDRKVGAVLDLLKADGLSDNTIVVFFADNGQSHIRGKQFCYEEGLHVPLIVRWPAKLPPPSQYGVGKVDDRLLMATDLAPTMLAVAGVSIPEKMQGAPFLGDRAASPRQYIFGARDRCDETAKRIRTVRDDRYRYIRNFTPDRPFLQPNQYKERSYPVWNLLKELHAAAKLTPPQEFLCAPAMPAEELYDLQQDPHEIENLAGLPDHGNTLQRMRDQLSHWIEATGDQGRTPESDELIRRKGVTQPNTPPNRGFGPRLP